MGKSLAIFYDEFSVSERPTIFYAWAPKNTLPKIASNERHRKRCNGLLPVDAFTGEEYLKLRDRAKAEDVSDYLTSLVLKCVKEDYSKLYIILDNCKTHKKKMRELLSKALEKAGVVQKIAVEFVDLPAYSPDFKLVEYIIHQIRLQILHHQPIGMTLEQVKARLEQHLQKGQMQTKQQIQNILKHILSLGA